MPDDGGWFADDGFWTDYAPILFDAGAWDEAPDAVDSILKLVGARPGCAVLDICCGPGRHAAEFARRGCRVTGIDITEPYLDAARSTAAAEGFDIEYLRADAREFARPGAFDLAVNLFTSFGYFDDPADDERMARRAFESLAPGGVLVMELAGKETTARDFRDGEWFERDGRLILTEQAVVGAWEGIRHRWMVVDGNRRIDRTWFRRLYAGTELAALLRRAGFADVSLYGSFDGAPYGPEARTLVAVARVAPVATTPSGTVLTAPGA